MTEEERKIKMREVIRTRSCDEVLGDFENIIDGTYDVTISKVYKSKNKNGKEFLGIQCTINSGTYAGNFFVECIYFNDDALERGLQRVRNILFSFNLSDLTEDDINNNRLLERLSEIKGKHTKIYVETDGEMKSYEYNVE